LIYYLPITKCRESTRSCGRPECDFSPLGRSPTIPFKNFSWHTHTHTHMHTHAHTHTHILTRLHRGWRFFWYYFCHTFQGSYGFFMSVTMIKRCSTTSDIQIFHRHMYKGVSFIDYYLWCYWLSEKRQKGEDICCRQRKLQKRKVHA